MKSKDILTSVAVAAGTMGITLVLMMPAGLSAGNDSSKPAAEIKTPELTVDGCVLTLATEKPTYGVGETPVVILHATNTSDTAVHLSPQVTMRDIAAGFLGGRTMPMPRETFRKESDLTLAPGARTTVTIVTDKPVEAGHNISFTVSVGDKRIDVPGFQMPLTLGAFTTTQPATFNTTISQFGVVSLGTSPFGAGIVSITSSTQLGTVSLETSPKR